MTIDVSNLYAEAVAQGIETDHHATDLYLKDSAITRTLLRVAHVNATSFQSARGDGLWWEIPFAYTPGWPSKAVQS